MATEAKTAESAAMAAVMAAAAVLSVAEVMALMMAMAAARLRQERGGRARRQPLSKYCPSSGNLRRPWVGLAWIRKET